jgi:hypothetical protein
MKSTKTFRNCGTGIEEFHTIARLSNTSHRGSASSVCGAYTASCSMRTGKKTVNHPLAENAEVRSEWSFTSIPQYSFMTYEGTDISSPLLAYLM